MTFISFWNILQQWVLPSLHSFNYHIFNNMAASLESTATIQHWHRTIPVRGRPVVEWRIGFNAYVVYFKALLSNCFKLGVFKVWPCLHPPEEQLRLLRPSQHPSFPMKDVNRRYTAYCPNRLHYLRADSHFTEVKVQFVNCFTRISPSFMALIYKSSF